MRTVCGLFLSLFLVSNAFPQALTIDKLERTVLGQARMEVGFTALLEGAIDNPDLAVFVMVEQPRLKGWRFFPATTSTDPESKGAYRWRAICQFGDLDGRGKGDNHQLRAVAIDKSQISRGLPVKLQPAAQTNVIVLKRTR